MIDQSITKPASTPLRLCQETHSRKEQKSRSPAARDKPHPGATGHGEHVQNNEHRKKEVGFEGVEDSTDLSNSAFVVEKLHEPGEKSFFYLDANSESPFRGGISCAGVLPSTRAFI